MEMNSSLIEWNNLRRMNFQNSSEQSITEIYEHTNLERVEEMHRIIKR